MAVDKRRRGGKYLYLNVVAVNTTPGTQPRSNCSMRVPAKRGVRGTAFRTRSIGVQIPPMEVCSLERAPFRSNLKLADWTGNELVEGFL
jgi:hypothetical protein